jgi:hypothetical protein
MIRALHRSMRTEAPPWWLWCGAAVLGAACIAVPAGLAFPPWVVLLFPLGLLGAGAVLESGVLGICIAAFSIAPLGALQAEIGPVTLNFPEVIILCIVGRTAIVWLRQPGAIPAATPWKTLGLYFLAAGVALVIGIAAGNGVSASLQDWRQFTEFLLLFAVVVMTLREYRQVVWVLAAYAAGCALIGLHGILQQYLPIQVPYMQQLSDEILHEGTRSRSFYGPTPLGALMVLGMGPAIALALTPRPRLIRLGFAGLALLMAAAAVYTKTRASWIAIALMLVFIFISVPKRPAMLFVSAVAVAGMLAVLGPIIATRLGTLHVSKAESSLLERIQYYTAAWHIFRAHPVFGLGFGCYYSTDEILMNEQYVARSMPDRPGGGSFVEATVHSAYLQMLVKGGLVFLGAFMAFVAAWLGLVLRERRWRRIDDPEHILFAGVAGALIGYLFHSGFENFFQWPVMAQSFWLLMGISVVLGGRVIRQGRHLSTQATEHKE